MLLSTPAYNPNVTAPDFSLTDVVSGEVITPTEQDLSNGFVVAFICNHCPYVLKIIDEFVAVADALAAEGIPLFAVMSNNYEFVPADAPDRMKEFATEHNFAFPYLVDEDQSVARAYDAVCTPDIFGFNAEKQMRYRGNIAGLEAAMQQIKESGTAPENQAASSGCSIKWK